MNLPQPSAEALEQSERLCALVKARLTAAGGWLSFADYMGLVLYTPGLGYYSGGARKFGPAGDFITAPELTPLFGQAVATELAAIMAASAPVVLEVGAGTGLLAADLLKALAERACLPERYFILELSGELRARQGETLAAQVPALQDRVVWLDRLPERFSGAVLANEVLDVMPTELLVWRDGALFERGVGQNAAGQLCWADRPASAALEALARTLPVAMPPAGTEFVSEVHRAAQAWVGEWAKRLDKGAMLLIDYGYPRAEYYLPSRVGGTLLCYYRHHAHGDPFLWPGLNDITTFVDFTAMAEAGFGAGLEVIGYTNQAQWLFNCGLLEALARRGACESADYLRAARAVQRLTAPHEMGELFKVLALGRGIAALPGFRRGDRLHAL